MEAFSVKQFSGMNDYLHPSLLSGGIAAFLENAVIDNGKITPMRLPEKLTVSDPERFGHYGTVNRSVVKWYERYYWSDNKAAAVPYYGGNVENLGVPYPEVQPTITQEAPADGEAGLTGDFKYCICYVNANGWEGAPGSLTEYWVEVTLSAKWAKITAPAFPSGVSYAKVYRTGDKGADFYNVGEITTSGGSLIDKTDETTLTMLPPLTSENNYPPPNGGKYLSESGGVFFLAVADRLYFSLQGNPHAWPTLNFLGIGDKITGIVPEFQGVLVFTANNTYRVVGADSVETVTKSLLPGNQGCSNYHTIASVSNAPIWLSNDGLCMWDGESISLISRQVIRTDRLQIKYAVSANDEYILFLASGAIIFDRRNGNVFRKSSVRCDYAWYDGKTDNLYLQKSGELYLYGTGEKAEWTYKSPYIGGTELTTHKFYEMLVQCSAASEITFLIDGVEKKTLSLASDGRTRLKLPFDFNGINLQVKIKSLGELSELMVQYE